MLKLSKKLQAQPYTYKEVVELKFPEIWGGASEMVRMAKELQSLTLEMMPGWRKLLPSSFEQLKEDESAQAALFGYLTARSTYALAHEVVESVNLYCHDLARAKITDDAEQVEMNKKELVDIMELAGSVSESLEFLNDTENGFRTLEGLIDNYRPKLYFPVLHIFGYRDITETIRKNGVLSEDLWKAVLEDEIPHEVNVAGLMERPEDNELAVMY